MTQEEKDLLFQDLCARLPFGVKFKITETHTETLRSIGIGSLGLIPINLFYKTPEFYLINEFGNLEYKPFLRPMSSMTDEEKRMYTTLRAHAAPFTIVKWLDENMFDHRTDMSGEHLIELGLALEAPKDMYK